MNRLTEFVRPDIRTPFARREAPENLCINARRASR
jgi:hypothetical protein